MLWVVLPTGCDVNLFSHALAATILTLRPLATSFHAVVRFHPWCQRASSSTRRRHYSHLANACQYELSLGRHHTQPANTYIFENQIALLGNMLRLLGYFFTLHCCIFLLIILSGHSSFRGCVLAKNFTPQYSA